MQLSTVTVTVAVTAAHGSSGEKVSERIQVMDNVLGLTSFSSDSQAGRSHNNSKQRGETHLVGSGWMKCMCVVVKLQRKSMLCEEDVWERFRGELW